MNFSIFFTCIDQDSILIFFFFLLFTIQYTNISQYNYLPNKLAVSIISMQVYQWGRGENGRLGFGDNDKSCKMLPQKVHLLAGENIVQVLA